MTPTILLVDDEPQILQALAGLLQDEDFEVLTAPEGETALKMVREEPPDLVMLDIALPGKDGLEILKDLKDQHPTLPVIMISAYGSVENAVKATRLGAYDFIEKPPHADKILLSVRNALDMARLADENRRLRQQATPVSGNHRPKSGHPASQGKGAPGGPHHRQRLDHRRKRHGQGTGGPGPSFPIAGGPTAPLWRSTAPPSPRI